MKKFITPNTITIILIIICIILVILFPLFSESEYLLNEKSDNILINVMIFISIILLLFEVINFSDLKNFNSFKPEENIKLKNNNINLSFQKIKERIFDQIIMQRILSIFYLILGITIAIITLLYLFNSLILKNIKDIKSVIIIILFSEAFAFFFLNLFKKTLTNIINLQSKLQDIEIFEKALEYNLFENKGEINQEISTQLFQFSTNIKQDKGEKLESVISRYINKL